LASSRHALSINNYFIKEFLLKKVYIIISLSLVSLFSLSAHKDITKLSYNLVHGLPPIYIDAHSEKIGHTWSNGTVWEQHLIQKFYALLPKNEFFVVLDLGAQTGCFTLLAKYFPNSAWYAFEPITEAATTLQNNLTLNDIHNVSVHQMAVTDFSGTITLKMPSMHAWGLSTIGSNPMRFTPVMEREIQCINLDSFIDAQKINKVHFMKLDTEGSELSILRGAQKMIMRDRPIMLIEYNDINMQQCSISKQELHAFLKELGYTWQLVSTEDILCIPNK
jgi:FkbM family methyltransferase